MRAFEEILNDIRQAFGINDAEALLRFANELDEIGSQQAEAPASTARGWALYLTGDYPLALEHNRRALAMFDEDARRVGGIQGEDRYGVPRFFPCTTLSIGAVAIDGSQFSRAEEVANLAAQSKHLAKMSAAGVYVHQAQG